MSLLFLNELIHILKFLFIPNLVNIDRYNPHKQKLFGGLSF